MKVCVYLRVVGISSSVAGLNGSNVSSIAISLQNQSNLINADIKGTSTASEIVLTSSSRDRQLEVDGIIHHQRNTLQTADVDHASEPTRSGVGDLAHQLTRKVGISSKRIGGVVVARDIRVVG